jgi:hypothetical protein
MSTVPVRPRLGPAYSPTVRDLRRGGQVRGVVAGLLLATALLSGCSGTTEANDTLPSASPAPTTEALPPIGPADFPVPDEARTKDAAGAEAFVRYYIELLNRQQALPAGQPLRDLSSECATCERIARAFDDAAAAGHVYNGGELTLKDVLEPQLDGDTASLIFWVQVEALSLRDPAGGLVPDGQHGLITDAGSGMNLVWSEEDRSWLAAGLTIG